MGSKLNRQNCWLKGSKTFHHVAVFRIVKKKEGNGELRMVTHSPWWAGNEREWASLTDSHVKDVFVWLGRYLAMKGKLPRNFSLEEIAVGAQRTAKAIREINASEIFAQMNTQGSSGIEMEEQ